MLDTTNRRISNLPMCAGVIGTLLIALLLTVVSGKNVHVSLATKWRETSMIAEVCEGVALTKGPSGFFSCVGEVADAIAAAAVSPSTATPEDHYKVAVKLLQTSMAESPAESKALVGAELASRVHSPRVEAHRQLAAQHTGVDTSKKWFIALSDGTVLYEAAAAVEAVASAPSRSATVEEFAGVDHVFPGSSKDSAARVVLYGDVTDPEAQEALKVLAAAAAHGSIRFLFRHSSTFVADAIPQWDGVVGVQGYGVTLDVKNMEYKAVDEKKPKTGKESGSASAASDDEQNIGGFDIAKLKQRKPSLNIALSDFASELAEKVGKEQEDVQLDLQVWELQQLGFQAAMHILKSKSQIETLEDLLSNFPLRAGKISKLTFSASALRVLQTQLAPLQRMFGEGTNAAFLNGRALSDDKFDLFSVLAELRKEERFLSDLENVMLYSGAKNVSIEASSEYEKNFFLHRARTCQLQKQERKEKAKRIWFDQLRISWMNDLAKTPLYPEAGTSLKAMFRTTYYGQPLFPARNVFHAVYLIDPSQRDGLDLIPTIQRFLVGGSAARMGLVLVDSAFSMDDERHYYATAFGVDGTAESATPPLKASVSALIQAVAFQLDDNKLLVEFLVDLLRNTVKPVVTEEQVRESAALFLGDVTLDAVLSSPNFYTHYRDLSRYVKSTGLRTFPVMLFNGVVVTENVEQAFFPTFQQEFHLIRDMITRSELTDDVVDIYDFMMQVTGALRRYQPAVFDKPTYVALKSQAQASFLELRPYVRGAGYDGQASLISHVLVLPAVLNTLSLKMLDRALDHLEQCTTCPGVQLTIAACASADGTAVLKPSSSVLHRVLEGTLQGVSKRTEDGAAVKALRAVTTAVLSFIEGQYPTQQSLKMEFVAEVDAAIAQHLRDSSASLPDEAKQAIYNEKIVSESTERSIRNFCSATAESEPKMVGLVPFLLTNGRRIVFDESFTADDYLLLEVDEAALTNAVFGCIETVDIPSLLAKTLKEEEVTKHIISTKLGLVNSILRHDHVSRGARMEKLYLPYPTTPYSFAVNSTVNPNSARHTLNVVLNPVARESQQLAALVRFVASLDDLGVSSIVYVNPPAELQKVPITNFYQFVGQKKPSFDEEGGVVSPAAYLKNMPQSQTLTLGLVEPEAWMVFASAAAQDLDNIRLNTLHGSKLRAEYTLQSILLTGSCQDVTTENRPRGLPLVLTRVGAEGRTVTTDTQVMSNYGYFQLQASPGVWQMSVQEGLASSIYEVVDIEEKDPSALWSAYYARKISSSKQQEFSSRPVPIISFTGKHVNLLVKKREGKESVDLLEALKSQEDDAQVWPPTTGPQPTRPTKPTLNVFSVASGHLYERFMRMMMHTVMKSSSDVHGANTTRIKFWMIENFLSPKFKALVPRMAEKFGFDYGFVTYRWPHWLRRQTEKQRTIWGYKILFLDVLFPLDVDKVIFVDADQIVQADLHELYNLDLEGKAVAYTPFCQVNKNEETVGFRFWNQGFWHDHLAGRPYHISAIYVVDLKRLRRMAAGDQYRMIYENLSADPNSLANLDQDLPNFAQNQVPIHSLPEEWLWCETWCNQESKSRAKTIDLCNNPLTKTPKLENVKRIIPNWEETDAMLESMMSE
jgi:UDP-glucose:glycoprotein glucosyltransferase